MNVSAGLHMYAMYLLTHDRVNYWETTWQSTSYERSRVYTSLLPRFATARGFLFGQSPAVPRPWHYISERIRAEKMT